MISSVATYVIGSWYNSCGTTLLHQVARIEKQAKKLIRKQDHQTLLTPDNVYKTSATASTKKIMAESQHPLHSYFKWLPSGVRLSSPSCRTNRHRDTAVPSFIRLFNENIERPSPNESELNPQQTIHPVLHPLYHTSGAISIFLNTSQHPQTIISILHLYQYFCNTLV